MQSELLFSLLVVGLEKYTHAKAVYPFPAELQHAMNGLALVMGLDYPKTRRAFLDLMNEPLDACWIAHGGTPIPDFDNGLALLYGHELSDAAEEFLLNGKLRGVSLEEVSIIQDDAYMRRFFAQMRDAFQKATDDDEAVEIEKDYAEVRSFVIRNA